MWRGPRRAKSCASTPADPEGSVPPDENIAAVAAHEMMDVSLSALRMGAREVNIVCLERRDEMPAALEEIEEAEAEGIVMHAGFGPKRVLGRDGNVAGLEVVKTKSVFDANWPLQSGVRRQQRVRHRMRHRDPRHRADHQAGFSATGGRRCSEPARSHRRRPQVADHHRARHFRRRRLRFRTAPHHRQRRRRQEDRHRHR